VRDVRDVAEIADERHALSAPLQEEEVARARRVLRREEEQRGAALDRADREASLGVGGVSGEVAVDLLAAARGLRDEVEAALFGEERAETFPVSRVEERHVVSQALSFG